MKKKILTLGMVFFLSLVSFSLFAQATGRTISLASIETKLTADGKKWQWYKDSQLSADKIEIYSFNANHKVEITQGTKATNTTWKLSQTDPAGIKTTITIGTKNYDLSFGSDSEHSEYMVLTGIKPTPSISSYYKSLLVR